MTDEQRAKRIHHHMYETCEGIAEHAERIVRLEEENAKLRELVSWMYRLMDESCAVQHPYAPEPIRYDTLIDVYEKLRELGIEMTENV